MKAIIVDDEPKAIVLLTNYIDHFNAIEVVATFRNGIKAFDFLSKEKVDLIFLDINMPHLSGISLSKMIDSKTKIIFTTAYSEYAVESYDVDAVDYLLKPISFERFTKAIGKILNNKTVEDEKAGKSIMIKSGSKIFRLVPQHIFHLEKDGNYMIYHLNEQKILARSSVTEALAALPKNFIQIHKSHIINIRKVDFISKNEISVNQKMIPIGPSFKEAVMKRIESA